MQDNLIQFFRSKHEVFPLRRDVELHRMLEDAVDKPWASLPVPAKIFLVDELAPHSYGFPVTSSPALTEVETRLEKWIAAEIGARAGDGRQTRAEETLAGYRTLVIKLARNALESSILADYHAVFWLVHSQQLAKVFTSLPRTAMSSVPGMTRDDADAFKYQLWTRWQHTIREALADITSITRFTPGADERTTRFTQLLLDNPLLTTEDFISPDLREMRSYFMGHLRRDVTTFRRWFDDLRSTAAGLMQSDRLFRRAMLLLGYPDAVPSFLALLDRRVQELVQDHPSWKPHADQAFFGSITRRVLEHLIVFHLRRGITWMKTTAEGENVSEDEAQSIVYSRAIRPMNFGRRGIVEPIVYRYGLVYDITSFTQTLGEIARGGKEEEQTSYRQMLAFQRDLAEITARNGLQFEKFLGDGAFYTSRRATRTIQAAVAIQDFYSARRREGFAFNKGMRIALNYGYYRLLPMQVSVDGTEIKEFYGPGIVELSRLTTGKATKELEDIQHLLLSHGYDQMEVYRFFAPLSRAGGGDKTIEKREFYAYVNENGHLMNEGIVASIAFLKQLTAELQEDAQRIYRLRTEWANYLGFPTSDSDAYIGVRILGSVSLKGIGNMEVAEIVRLTTQDADISMVDDQRPLLQLLQMERNRSAARTVAGDTTDLTTADLVVCQSNVASGGPVILVGEWDPVSEEVRRPIQLGEADAERYGLAVPLSAEVVEQQSASYQKLYRKLCAIETLPNFSVQAIKDNTNFSGFIIGETVERL